MNVSDQEVSADHLVSDESTVSVECYSGHTYAQEPRAFVFGHVRRVVTFVHKRWREPAGPCFEVGADDAQVYRLCYHEAAGNWTASAVPRGGLISGIMDAPEQQNSEGDQR